MRTLTERAKTERALPKLWVDGQFRTERVDWYTRLVVAHPASWGGRETVAEFIAAMMLESGLNNLTLGNNAEHGNNNPFIGVGWCQLDTGYHATTVEAVHGIRADPVWSLDYIAGNDDLAYRGATQLWLNKQRWHAWEADRLDPKDPAVWSPYKACLAAYDRVTAA